MATSASTDDMQVVFSTFTLPQAISVVGEVVKVSRQAKRNKSLFFAALNAMSAEVKATIRAVASERVGTKRRARASAAVPRKRRRVDTEEQGALEPTDPPDEDLLTGPFFEAPTEETTQAVVSRMIDRTSNAALAKKMCMVCARLLFMHLLEVMRWQNIPNGRKLVPSRPHPAHKLMGHWLLHEDALAESTTYICLECKHKLLLDELPPLALANRMWIGKTPFELAILTLPERLLVALYFPAAYVVKLFPKVKGAEFWDRKAVNNGLKGNVSTYRLNTAQIAGIVSGNVMPPPPSILAATIGVTFVGAGNKPLAVFPDFLRVRRDRVFLALLWLKRHNALYGDIEISEDQLRLLPVDGVPEQISQNARYSNDVARLEREQAGYVPADAEDEEMEARFAMQGDDFGIDRNVSLPEEQDDGDYEPGVFPLQAHGVLDVEGETVPDSDLLAHGLSNVAARTVQKDFLIRKGSAFVNEYPRLDEDGNRFDGGPGNPNHMLGAFPVLFPYGEGGLEVAREVAVPYETHVRWALQYSDGRFRKDLYFVFQAFGVIQKRQVCRSAGLQIKRSSFLANQVSFLKLRPKDFLLASTEETRRVQFSNPVIRNLRKQLTSLRARVAGTDESRISIRGKVWGMNLRFNPPRMVNGYIGTVEAQARGTLHLHILLWLKGAPTAEQMRAALGTEEFRKKVTSFLKNTIRADIKGTTGETVLQLKKQSSVSYSRPVDPRLPNYELRRHEAEAVLARAVQVHDCKVTTCLKTRNGRLVCKRRAPWQLAADDWVLPTGEWGPRRVFGRLNAWNPPLLQVTRSNQDMKIITNGRDTKDITFYITLYIAKKQNQSANASALLAKSTAFQRQPAGASDSRDINKKMIQQCANTLSRHQELSGSEVPLKDKDHLGVPLPEAAREEQHDPNVRLEVVDGVFVLKDQLKEYADRGEQLETMNYYDYHVDTYDGKPLKNVARHVAGGDGEQGAPDEDSAQHGRPASTRIPYLASSNRKGCRVLRSKNLETLPHFIGTWFPRTTTGEYYQANILALLKPWRDLRDLTGPDGTFKTAFEIFYAGASEKHRRIIENINYFHECTDSARRRDNIPLEDIAGAVDLQDEQRLAMDLEELEALVLPMTEADVNAARNERYASREFMYGEGAMNVAFSLGIFEQDAPVVASGPMCERASLDDATKYAGWGEKLRALTRRAELATDNTLPLPAVDAAVFSGQPSAYDAIVTEAPAQQGPTLRTPEQQNALDILNVEQRRAHDIIEQHVRRTMAGVQQDQLLMIVRGEGGTGKTVLLNAIAHTFAFLKVEEWLAKTATTGVAASLVGGVTVHQWAAIPVANAEDSAEWTQRASSANVERRKRNILPARYVNVDECSMLTKQLLAQLSQSEIGMAIYHQFSTVVTLTEQKRIVDVHWKELLQRLRVGACTEEDIETLKSLQLKDARCERADWNAPPWDGAVLVTPRHGARVRWNTASVMKHCKATGNRMYISQAEDTTGRNEEGLNIQQRVIVAGMPVKKTGKLAERVELAIGMRAMVLVNIATEADLANGTRGVIVDIKLDPREPEEATIDEETGATMLRYPPVVVLFKPDASSVPAFEGLEKGILPIVPTKMGFTIHPDGGSSCRVNPDNRRCRTFEYNRGTGGTIKELSKSKMSQGRIERVSSVASLRQSSLCIYVRRLRVERVERRPCINGGL
ncbi:hypothetical protein B0H11DRAFT_1910735 [Mycena galericulata]|nr:hypothetical protein B0H11DRAFT_1910735 [Mycena galericulata]